MVEVKQHHPIDNCPRVWMPLLTTTMTTRATATVTAAVAAAVVVGNKDIGSNTHTTIN